MFPKPRRILGGLPRIAPLHPCPAPPPPHPNTTHFPPPHASAHAPCRTPAPALCLLAFRAGCPSSSSNACLISLPCTQFSGFMLLAAAGHQMPFADLLSPPAGSQHLIGTCQTAGSLQPAACGPLAPRPFHGVVLFHLATQIPGKISSLRLPSRPAQLPCPCVRTARFCPMCCPFFARAAWLSNFEPALPFLHHAWRAGSPSLPSFPLLCAFDRRLVDAPA